MGNFHEERRKMRFGQVERMLASDVTVAEWCRLNHVESTMHHCLKAYREGNGSDDGRRNGWIELDRKGIRESKALAVVEARSEVVSSVAASENVLPCTPRPYPQVNISRQTVHDSIVHRCVVPLLGGAHR